MGESLLITLREGFEAGLTVAIVFAFLRKTQRMDLARSVWAGIVVALAISVAGGIILHATLGGLEGTARLRTFAAVAIVASALLVWMIFWMRQQARHIKSDVEGKLAQAVASGSAVGLATVAFLAIVRDGLETSLFLIASTTSAADLGWGALVGGVIGVCIAVALTYLVYSGGSRIPIKRFFQVSGVVMALFAAGLLSKGVMYLQQAGDLGSLNLAAFNLTNHMWLTIDTESGKFLNALFGWDPRPSVEQVLAYLALAVPTLVLFFRRDKVRPAAPVPVDDGVPSRTPQAPRQSVSAAH